MDAQRGFMEAIRESPDEPLHRLAWADWLDDDGRHTRADFMRACIHAERLQITDPRRAAHEDEANTLLDAQEFHWLGPIAEIALDWRWHAGCVERVTVRASALLQRGDELLAAAPIRDMRILGDDREFAFLAAWPGLAKLEKLDLGVKPLEGEPALIGYVLRDAPLGTLLASPHLRGLRSLRLSGHRFSNPLVQSLIEQGILKRLRSLNLSGCQAVGNRAARMLADADAPHLDFLDVSGTNIDITGVAALLEAPRWPTPRQLGLLGPLPFGIALPAGVTLASRSAMHWDLPEWLERQAASPPATLPLAGALSGTHNLHALADWPGLAACRHLDLNSNWLTDSAFLILARSPHLRIVESLNLADNRIGGPGLNALLAAGGFQGLESLDVSRNHIGGFGLSLLAGGDLPRLRRLSACDANIDADALACLAGSPLLRRLSLLQLDNNPLHDALPRLLSAGPVRLRELHLARCGLDSQSCDALCDPDAFPRLRFVSAPGNHFSDSEKARLRRRFGPGLLGPDV